jgi:hypothetical protein
MTELSSIGAPQPTQDERTFASLAHILQLVGAFIAPLIIFLIKRESRFVSFHALQALLLQIAYMVIMAAFMMVWFASFFLTIAHQSGGNNAQPPPTLFILFPLIWLSFMGLWVLILVLAIVYGIKAGRGEWAEYPVLGRLARHLLKIGPRGTSLPA